MSESENGDVSAQVENEETKEDPRTCYGEDIVYTHDKDTFY